jgi:hypothetical protein
MKLLTNIELCEMPNEEVAGRAKLKMSALKVSENDTDNNENGLNWVKDYIEPNLKSFIGASYKVAFIDDEKTYPSGHGNMQYDEEGNVIFPDSDTVGSIQDAYIETIELDGTPTSVVTTEGFLYKQSYPNFYSWLKDETSKGTVFGSVEINGKGNSKKIIYANESKNSDGTPKDGRKPKIFDFTAVAILSDFVPPADKYSRVLEINSKTIDSKELNNSFDDKEQKNSKEVKQEMDDNKVILELNQKIENKTTEINQLTASNTELTDKNAELSEAVVNANKSLEEANTQVNSLTEELNACKKELNEMKAEKEAEKEEAEKNQKIAETKEYFDNEIPKNHFAEEEVNSLKSYVEAGDLVGLKSAESEICTKKFKEMKQSEEKELEVEVNSASKSFIMFHEKEKKNITNSSDVKFFD